MDKYMPIITLLGDEVNQYFLTKKVYQYEEDFWWALPLNIYRKYHALTLSEHALTLSEAEHAITWWTTKALNNERIMPTSIEIKKVD